MWQESIQAIQQGLAPLLQPPAKAVGARQIQLRPQAPLAQETPPVIAPAIRLRSAADRIVAMPAKRVRGDPVLHSQLLAEQRLRSTGWASEIHPLERERHFCLGARNSQNPRHAHSVRASQCLESFRLRLEHGPSRTRGDLHEQGAGTAVPAAGFIDRPAVNTCDRLPFQGRANGFPNLGGEVGHGEEGLAESAGRFRLLTRSAQGWRTERDYRPPGVIRHMTSLQDVSDCSIALRGLADREGFEPSKGF